MGAPAGSQPAKMRHYRSIEVGIGKSSLDQSLFPTSSRRKSGSMLS